MKNSKLRRALLLVACAVLLVSVSVSATLAYLTSKTTVVSNTFSVGKVEITLDEAKVDLYGVKAGDTRVTENVYKLMPGHNYTKDPTVHVSADSEPCYLFVEVVNGIKDIEAAGNTEIYRQMTEKYFWKQLVVDGKDVANVFYLTTDGTNPKTANAGTNPVVFGNFKISENVKNAPETRVEGELYIEDFETQGNKDAKIDITAYAVQSDGFTTPADAWKATFGAPTTPDAGETTN